VSKCFEWEKPIKYSQVRNRYYQKEPQTQEKAFGSTKNTCAERKLNEK
jgi:hypothetical protein